MAQIIRAAQITDEPVVISYRRADAAAPAPEIAPLPEEAPLLLRDEPPPASPVEEEAPGVSLEEARRQAAEEGYRDGYEAGGEKARAELAGELEALRSLGGALREALGRGIEDLEDVMAEIAFAAVCKLMGQAALTEEGVRAMVRQAMREAQNREGLVVRISPRDYELLHADSARARALVDDAKVEVVADDRVSSGCLIETSGGTLDARLEVQMRQLLDTLTRARDAAAE